MTNFNKNHAVLFLILLIMGPMLKVFFNAREEIIIAEKMLELNKPEKATTHYVRSIQWHIPLASLADKAATGLWKQAETYEKNGSLEKALEAFRLLRGAFYSTRSFYTPGQTWIDRSNEKIAHLMASLPPAAKKEAGQTFEERKERAYQSLTQEKSPRTFPAFLATLGFFGWSASVGLFIFLGFTPDGRIIKKPARFWTASFLLFYILWIAGLFYT